MESILEKAQGKKMNEGNTSSLPGEDSSVEPS